MNAFVKKELRLVLPSSLVVLALAILVPWFSWRDPDASFTLTPVFLFFGVVLLAVDSFGREFSFGTFSGLMAQPIERKKIWWTKISILFSAAFLIFVAYFASSEMVFQTALKIPVWNANPKILTADFHHGLFGAMTAILIALAGGLWTTILLRQIAAAFWITFLTPLGTMMLIVFFLPSKWPEELIAPLLGVLAVVYSVAGFVFAHKMFFRAQDAAWTGGVISFSKWRYFESGNKNDSARRERKPFLALLKKEFQLHSISLFCVGALLAMHIVVIMVRAFHGRFENNSALGTITEFFWLFWLVLPIVIGCLAVAEERKLGVVNEQFCLPVSRRRQFLIKLIPTLIFGALLGGVMPLLLEGIGVRMGVSNVLFDEGSHTTGGIFSGVFWFCLGIIGMATGFAVGGFWASTLAKNFMQALSIAIVLDIAGFFFWISISASNWARHSFGIALPLLAIVAAIIFIPWLAWRNFNHFTEANRLWRRNIFGVIGALLFMFAGSAAIYYRAWEFVQPLEPAHGAAKFSLANPPKLQSDLREGLEVYLADGRVWYANLKSYWFGDFPSRQAEFWNHLIRQLPLLAGPQQFVGGSDWASVSQPRQIKFNDKSGRLVEGYLDTVGIQTDGSLWISSEARPGKWTGTDMKQFGEDKDWKQVISFWYGDFFLLKTDGTLWRWQRDADWRRWPRDWETNWPTVRKFQPQKISATSDWREFFQIANGYTQKKDGTAWRIATSRETNGMDVDFIAETNLDSVPPKTFSWGSGSTESGSASEGFVKNDGTLWVYDLQKKPHGFFQVGTETNWINVAMMSWERVVALKSDGSLWQWNLNARDENLTVADVMKIPPTPLGTHHDWVSLTSTFDGAITLAADGGLWLWPNPERFRGELMMASRRPEFLGNVFGGEN